MRKKWSFYSAIRGNRATFKIGGREVAPPRILDLAGAELTYQPATQSTHPQNGRRNDP